MKPLNFEFFYLVETYSFEVLLPTTQIDNLEERVHEKVRRVFSRLALCTTYMGIYIHGYRSLAIFGLFLSEQWA